jgi:hypothetical protein
MPTRPTKGNHGHADRGSHERGGQKATYGSSVSHEVAEEQAEAIELDDDEASGFEVQIDDLPAPKPDRSSPPPHG